MGSLPHRQLRKNRIPVREFTERSLPHRQLRNVMPEEYITKGDSITSYRTYYKKGKKNLFSWKGRDVPDFIN
jgi:hypothetical protein